MDKEILRITDIEETALVLKRLYADHGYRKFKMSRFEEFEFYMDNRSFLEDDRITAFSDPSGKLLALRPDVTLSIVKNARDESEKVYYSEYVYRAVKNSGVIDEILQVGLERIAALDGFGVSEVIWLALESMRVLSDEYILDVSHMGILASLLYELKVEGAKREEIISCIGGKNAHDAYRKLTECGVDEARARSFTDFASSSGSFDEMLPKLRNASDSAYIAGIVDELETLYKALSEVGAEKHLRIDLSVVNDMSYYNGVVFSGYVRGVPFRVLSGGRYDNLLDRLGKNGAAIGFAVYLGKLERYAAPISHTADIMLTYDADTAPALVMRAVRELSGEGAPVRVYGPGEKCPEDIRTRYHIGKDGVIVNA